MSPTHTSTLPIVGIPGNHDGDVAQDDSGHPTGRQPLDTFLANFCTATPQAPPADPELEFGRHTQTLPWCDWTLRLQAVTIVGVYSNVPSGGHFETTQTDWMAAQLKAAPADRPLILTFHHPPLSVDAMHGGSQKMVDAVTHACATANRYPDVILNGHVHDYQRFSWNLAGHTITTIVQGNSGYHNLHKLARDAKPGLDLGNGVTFEYGDDKGYGFLTITVSGRRPPRHLHRRGAGDDAGWLRRHHHPGQGQLLSAPALAASRVLVTGATSGLGLAMARALADAGARVAVSSRDRERAQRVADELGAGAVGVAFDVRDAESVQAGIATVRERLGAIDMLVNNAGIGMRTVNPRFMSDPQPFWAVSPDGFRDVVDTKLAGCFLVARAVVPEMLASGAGRVVTISMNHATMTRRGFVPYGPAGAGLRRWRASWPPTSPTPRFGPTCCCPAAPRRRGCSPTRCRTPRARRCSTPRSWGRRSCGWPRRQPPTCTTSASWPASSRPGWPGGATRRRRGGAGVGAAARRRPGAPAARRGGPA